MISQQVLEIRTVRVHKDKIKKNRLLLVVPRTLKDGRKSKGSLTRKAKVYRVYVVALYLDGTLSFIVGTSKSADFGG